MRRCARPQLIRWFVAMFLLVWAVGSGCNPSLIDALGGNPITGVITPDGYIMILVMNKTGTSINTQIDITKENGDVNRQTISVAPSFFFTLAQDCNVAAIQVINFGYATAGGVVTSPSNLGTLTVNEGIQCGKVVAITASGNPPAFSVQVY